MRRRRPPADIDLSRLRAGRETPPLALQALFIGLGLAVLAFAACLILPGAQP